MAALSYSEITKENREYRSELLVDKVFSRDGKSNNFVVEGEGILVAEYIKINDKKISSGDTHDIVGMIFALKLLPVSKRKIVVCGKLQGQSAPTSFPIIQISYLYLWMFRNTCYFISYNICYR